MKAEIPKRRTELLKEFFLNASMIALAKEIDDEMARLNTVLRECGIAPVELGAGESLAAPAA